MTLIDRNFLKLSKICPSCRSRYEHLHCFVQVHFKISVNICINPREDRLSFFMVDLTYVFKRLGTLNGISAVALSTGIVNKTHSFINIVSDISASTGRNEFIYNIWLWHGDLYRVSLFQVYRTSTSCLQCDLEFFIFAVMKTFVTVISAFTGRNDFIFDIWLWHGDLYHVSPFQVYRTSTSCLPCDLQMNEWGYY
jgi:hypothetical protein